MEKNLKPIGTIFAESWRLYKKHMNVFALVAVIPFLFMGVKMVFVPYLYNFAGVPDSFAALTVFAVFSLLYLVFIIILPFAMTVAIGEADHGRSPDANQVYKKAFSSVWSYLLVLFLAAIVTLGGSILFIIPGIIASVYLSLALYVFVFEKKTGIDALVESAWYVRHFWWDILARKIILTLVVIAAFVVFAIIAGLCSLSFGFGTGVFQFLLDLFAFMVVIPFSFIFYYYIYKDVKRAKVAREEVGLPKPAFVLEAEKIYIILIVVAAVAALVIFCLISLVPHAAVGVAHHHGYYGRWR